jgi:predicted ribosomally synthesized peptide with SipW-like signal peptide
MTRDNTYYISRRRLLGGAGTVGVAAALGGVGTEAFLSDTEAVANNEFVAGELDLMVTWQEHYVDWSSDEMETETVDDLRSATATEAFPDDDGDGIQDEIRIRAEVAEDLFDRPLDELDATQRAMVESTFRSQFADVPDALEAPVVELQDIKPGDRGQVLFDLHLFDNPGYLWLTGAERQDADNGQTEPEADDPDEPADPDADGELDEAVSVTLWYDEDGNGLPDITTTGLEFVLL